jgi:hypothetical protein
MKLERIVDAMRTGGYSELSNGRGAVSDELEEPLRNDLITIESVIGPNGKLIAQHIRNVIAELTSDLCAARSLAEDLGHNAESWQNAYQRSVVFRDEALALADERDRELDLVRSFLRYITTHNDYARFRFPEMDEYLAALAPSTETRQDEMDRLAGKGAREVAEFRSQHIGDPFAPGHICFKCAALPTRHRRGRPT